MIIFHNLLKNIVLTYSKVDDFCFCHFRLLGPSTAADVLQLTNTLSQGPGHARVLLANDDLRIFSRQENEFLEDLFEVSGGEIFYLQ